MYTGWKGREEWEGYEEVKDEHNSSEGWVQDEKKEEKVVKVNKYKKDVKDE